MLDLDAYRGSTADYLRRRGHDLRRLGDHWVAVCPLHGDTDPSLHVYDDHAHCYGCQWHGDVYDLAGALEGAIGLEQQYAAVAAALGGAEPTPRERQPRQQRARTEPVPLPLSAYEGIPARTEQWGELVAQWPYLDAQGLALCVDARYERAGKKTVVTWWHDGQRLRTSRPPRVLWGQDQLAARPDAPVVVSEGCKAADAARQALPGWVSVTWSGGCGAVGRVDWSPLQGRRVVVIPDADEPGMRAARAIAERVEGARVVSLPDSVVASAGSGADAYDWAQVWTGDEIEAHLVAEPEPAPAPAPAQPEGADGAYWQRGGQLDPDGADVPFRLLGHDGEGTVYAVGLSERLQTRAEGGIAKNWLECLARHAWWHWAFGRRGTRGVPWDVACEWARLHLYSRDYDPDAMRGRGAWVDGDGEIVYHDGLSLLGRGGYLRLPRRVPYSASTRALPADVLAEIADAAEQLAFARRFDAVLLLGWSLLAPYCGALPWRPAILLTGRSGAGKTTILERVVGHLVGPVCLRASGDSTEAGVRQHLGRDARPVVIDEAEGEADGGASGARARLFALMRQSTSDQAPSVLRGSADGRSQSYAMRGMFLFASIAPEIANVADANRLTIVELGPPRGVWSAIAARLLDAYTEEHCQGVRLETWQQLPAILADADEYGRAIMAARGADTRTALSTGLLLAAYHRVLRGQRGVDAREAMRVVADLVGDAPDVETRDDAVEVVDRILDRGVSVRVDGAVHLWPLREVLIASRDGRHPAAASCAELSSADVAELRSVAATCGVREQDGRVYIAVRSPWIERELGLPAGYGPRIARHPGAVQGRHSTRIGGSSKRCVVIEGVLGEGEVVP